MRADDPITYEIDEQSRITAVNTAWFDEAQASGDERLSDSHLVGQSLWDLIRDQSTRHLYETLIAAARIHRDAVAFRFRCDTPDQRRLLRMQVTARPDGHVTFSVSLVASQL
ncbi:MAG: hypothetical protein H3C62_06935, partial [Gemmatimonadaceae bacterium]|nr:hypothetical protein [Gemmatimonadaceae bacterium]